MTNERAIRSILIGGGSAGWMTAAALSHNRPEGRRIEAEPFIDCPGFRGLPIEGALKAADHAVFIVQLRQAES